MVYLVASLLIHGFLFAFSGMTFIQHARYSVQPSDQAMEVSIEEIRYSGAALQQEGRSIKPQGSIHSISGVKVNAKPDHIQNPPPSYPELARQMRQEGLVMLSVDVSKEGYSLNMAIIESSGYPLLDQAALNAVRHWKFQPGRMGNMPVESTVTVPIRFRLEK